MVELKSGVRTVPEITRINTIQVAEHTVILVLSLNLLKRSLIVVFFQWSRGT